MTSETTRSEIKSQPTPTTRPPLADYLLMAVWFGLSLGIVEAILLAVKKYGRGQIVRLSPHAIWMGPLTYIVIFAATGLLLYGLARRWPGPFGLRTAVFLYAFLGLFGTLFMYEPFAVWTRLLMALFLAFQVTLIFTRYPQFWQKVMRYSMAWVSLFTRPALPEPEDTPPQEGVPSQLPGVPRREFLASAGITLAGLAAGVSVNEAISERRRLTSLPQLSTTGKPNVLLLVMDTVRAQNMSLHGYSRATSPNIDRLARSGARFDRAIATAPWTLPSHASMFTGKWHYELSADWLVPLDNSYPTLAESLSAAGYHTAGFVANVFYASYEHGLNRGFVRYNDYTKTAGEILAGASLGRTAGCWNRNEIGCKLRPMLGYYELLGRRTAADINEEFLDWHQQQDGSRPYFAFLNYFDAHAPYLPPDTFVQKFDSGITRGNPLHIDLPGWEWTADQQQAEQDAYDSAIAYVDHHIGQLLDELEKRGGLENTLVMITSDHGEEFGEHGVMAHSNSLYLPSVYVPFVAIYPGKIPAGTEVSAAFSLRDIPATIMDVAGLSDASPFPGRSLAPYWQDGNPVAPAEPLLSEVTGLSFRPNSYPVSKGTMFSVVLEHLHYIRRGDGHEELYDIDADPWERSDLAAGADGAERLAQFRAFLQNVPLRDSM